MKFLTKLPLALTLGVLIAAAASATVSGDLTFHDGEVLMPSKLNARFERLEEKVRKLTHICIRLQDRVRGLEDAPSKEAQHLLDELEPVQSYKLDSKIAPTILWGSTSTTEMNPSILRYYHETATPLKWGTLEVRQ